MFSRKNAGQAIRLIKFIVSFSRTIVEPLLNLSKVFTYDRMIHKSVNAWFMSGW